MRIAIEFEVNDAETVSGVNRIKGAIGSVQPPPPAVAQGFALLKARIIEATTATEQMARTATMDMKALTASGAQTSAFMSNMGNRMAASGQQVTRAFADMRVAADTARTAVTRPIVPRTDPTHIVGLTEHYNNLTFGMQKFARVAVSLQVIMATVTAVLGIRQIIEAADAWAQMSGRLRLVTASAADLAAVQSKLFTLAQELRLPIEDVAKLYTRLAVNAEALGLSQAQVLNLTRSISQAMQVSGSTATEAAAGVLQFTQAIAASNFAGDELRTLLEAQPRLLKAIGDGLKILSPEFRRLIDGGMATTAALRAMGKEGKLSADLLLAAISTQRDVLEREFQQLPRTVGQAWTQAMNVVNRALAGVSVTPLTDAIDAIKEKFQDSETAQRFTRFLSGSLELVGGTLQFVLGLVDRLSLAFDQLVLKQIRFLSAGMLTSSSVGTLLSSIASTLDNMVKTFLGLPDWLQAAGLIGVYLYGKAGIVGLMAAVTLYERLAKNFQALKEGMSLKDFAWSGPAEVDAFLKQIEEARRDSPSERNALRNEALREEMRTADIQLKQRAQTLEQIKKEVEETLKLADARATLARESAALWHAKGLINTETRLNLEIGAYENLDRVQTEQLKRLKAMPLEYAQLQAANIKTQQEVVTLTAKLNELTNSFQMSALGMQALNENLRAGLFHGPVEETERFAKNISLLDPPETPKLLQPSLWNAVKTSILGVGSSVQSVDDQTAKLIEKYRDPSFAEMITTERKIADVQLERIDLLEKLNKLTGFEASTQKLAIMQKQLQNLEATRAAFEGTVEEASNLDMEILKVKAGIKQLQDESNAFARIWDGITDILSIFGVKIGKFILMFQQISRVMTGFEKIAKGIGGIVGMVATPGTALAGMNWQGADGPISNVMRLGTVSGEAADSLGIFGGIISIATRFLGIFTKGLGVFSGKIATLLEQAGVPSGLAGGLGNAIGGGLASFGMTSLFTGNTIAGINSMIQGAVLNYFIPGLGSILATLNVTLATGIAKLFGGSKAANLGAQMGSWFGPLGSFIGGFLGSIFGKTPKGKLSASILPFDRDAFRFDVDKDAVPGTRVGDVIANVGGNIMKRKKENKIQQQLADMLNEILHSVVTSIVQLIEVLPTRLGNELDAALSQLEATGLEIVDKKWKGGKSAKKLKKRIKNLTDEAITDLVEALGFGDLDLKALGGGERGDAAKGFDAMMSAVSAMSYLIKLSGRDFAEYTGTLADFTKVTLDYFQQFQQEGEAMAETVKRITTAFAEGEALYHQLTDDVTGLTADLSQIAVRLDAAIAMLHDRTVTAVDALTVAVETMESPEEVVAAAKAAREAVLAELQVTIERVTQLRDVVGALNAAITKGVDLFADLSITLDSLGRVDSAADIQGQLDGLMALFNQVQDVTSRIALFSAGLQRLASNVEALTTHMPLVAEGFNAIMAQISQLTDPSQAIDALRQLAGAITSGLSTAIAAINAQMQQQIDALQDQKLAVQDHVDALETERDLIRESFDLRREALETEVELTREWGQTLESVKRMQTDLFMLLAPTQPLASLNTVLEQFRSAFSAFQGGPTVEGAERVQELARQVLQLAQQTPGFDLSSQAFQTLAAEIGAALSAIETIAGSQPTEAEVQARIADLNQEQVAALASIDAQIAAAREMQSEQLAAIDAQIAAVRQSAEMQIANLEQIAAAGLSTIRDQLGHQLGLLAEQQRIAQEQLQAVLGSMTFEEYIATKQQEAVTLLAGIQDTLQEYLGAIINNLFPEEPVTPPMTPIEAIDAMLRDFFSNISTKLNLPVPGMASGGIVMARPGGTLVRLGEGAYDEAVVPLRGHGVIAQSSDRAAARGNVTVNIGSGAVTVQVTGRESDHELDTKIAQAVVRVFRGPSPGHRDFVAAVRSAR